MNTLELEAYKAELAREVLNTNNQEVLDSIKDIIQRGEYVNAPCLMDISEAKQRLQNSEARFEKGEYISEINALKQNQRGRDSSLRSE